MRAFLFMRNVLTIDAPLRRFAERRGIFRNPKNEVC
jgi:hypothetical protein